MSHYTATVCWRRQPTERFTDGCYSRGHEWHFDGGVTVAASSSPHIVPLPYSADANVDPEEAFVAALSSCHMLVFLGIVAKRRFVVEHYEDNAVGVLEKNDAGRLAMTRVTLRPAVTFSGERRPTREQLETMHHQAHRGCFIANSVKTAVVTEIVEPRETP
ncbi:OsmC family peroxiredoxin [Salinicola corii]|uniref:OsmC family peroxiredoxin n=1 Tax=Salinicola corii TaxID=2606937 RepID=A0A640WIP0_9GAMM|nr:OsmC family protein [Salinicola corii]KAA0020402.1 OsmC family peroxiredoxin [Salinicola corii]